ncbi:MAG TPA: folylpolyglutamate synthase/dihydrofolate synthase family protein [Thermodesulfovibrionales bacterium]|nr:folylpolyglutamate synthase/dihydrofolate synthase family protein [Thermodesulfovibrionales bacterium]
MHKKEYKDSIGYLYGLQKHGIKLGLENTIRLLALLDNPQKSFRSIHIAGTNGKGSTAAMIASILSAAGFRVGLFTSPHLVSFTERIRVDNVEILESEVVELTQEIRNAILSAQSSRDAMQDVTQTTICDERSFLPTFFEFVTALGFLYFKRKGIEWAVVETGMGGKLDATNILVPAVSVITNISYDHREFLGQTLREIAREKAGIIKEAVPVVSAIQEAEVIGVIAKKATERGSSMHVHGIDFWAYPHTIDMRGITFSYEGTETMKGLRIPLTGLHQVENASLAVRAIEVGVEKNAISSYAVRQGLASAQWPGRLELIENKGYMYDYLIDGAHNPSASKALADSLQEYFIPSYGKIILIMGVMADKDMEGMMKPLLPLVSEIIFTAPEYERAASPERLAEYASAQGFLPTVRNSVKASMELAQKLAEKCSQKTLIVITGSFYTIGEAKSILGHECSAQSLARLR